MLAGYHQNRQRHNEDSYLITDSTMRLIVHYAFFLTSLSFLLSGADSWLIVFYHRKRLSADVSVQ